MTEFTTPDFVFRIKDKNIDLANAKHIYLTLQQGTFQCTKTEEDLSVNKNTVSIWFTQDEISKFKAEGNKVEVQLNWTYEDLDGIHTRRAATRIKSFQVSRNLLKKVVE